MTKLSGWFNNLSRNKKIFVVAFASILSFNAVSVLAQPPQQASINQSNQATQEENAKAAESKIEKKLVEELQTVAFNSSTVDDSSLEKGTTGLRIAGQTGERKVGYEVTYVDGIETDRKEVSNVVTRKPVDEVKTVGTKVQQDLTCPNGTYVNIYGNEVCRPYESAGPPAGASAQCEDGTYSFSQSRRGTCSHHGGVAVWY